MLDDTVRHIRNKDYDKAMENITKDEMQDDDIERFIYLIVYELLNDNLEEYLFIKILGSFISTRIDFSKMKIIDKIKEIMTTNDFKSSRSVIEMIESIKQNEADIIRFINLIDWKKDKTNQELISIELYRYIENLIKYIDAFTSVGKQTVSDAQFCPIQNSILLTDNSIYNWEIRTEIKSRLILLLDKFGEKIIKDADIKMISIHDFDSLAVVDTIKYYDEIIMKMQNYMKIIMIKYRLYIKGINKINEINENMDKYIINVVKNIEIINASNI